MSSADTPPERRLRWRRRPTASDAMSVSPETAPKGARSADAGHSLWPVARRVSSQSERTTGAVSSVSSPEAGDANASAVRDGFATWNLRSDYGLRVFWRLN